MTTALLVLLAALGAPAAAPPPANPVVVLETTLGAIEIELDAEAAPLTVANFLEYVKAGHYDGLVFHRVIPGFMIQGGGMDAEMREKPTRATIKNEADNGLKNKRGTIAMARKPDPDSASAQFFINVANNAALDHRDKTTQGYGYAVFGKVTAGMDVADRIVAVKTGRRGPFSDVPVEPVTITRARLK